MMAVFDICDGTKLITGRIWVAEKCLNFHTVLFLYYTIIEENDSNDVIDFDWERIHISTIFLESHWKEIGTFNNETISKSSLK